MSPDKLQVYIIRQHIQRQLWDLEEEYRTTKGYSRIGLAKKIKKKRADLAEIDNNLKGMK